MRSRELKVLYGSGVLKGYKIKPCIINRLFQAKANGVFNPIVFVTITYRLV